MTENGRKVSRRRGGPGIPSGGRVIRSLPALAAAMRRIDRCPLPASSTTIFSARSLSPAYRLQNHSAAREARAAVHTISQVADRLRRLARAYGEWKEFDVPAFFDLWPEHAARLIRVEERVSTVNVTFFADMLLPTFRFVEQYWVAEFFPSYQSAMPLPDIVEGCSSFTAHFLHYEQPKMRAYWEKLTDVVHEARRELWNDIGFLAAAAAGEEKALWQWAWRPPPPPGLDPRLLPPLRTLPTLTLATEFPLPAYRQPGRLQRLRRTWESGRLRPGSDF